MRIFISSRAKVLAELEIYQEFSSFLTDSKRIQKALSPLPIKAKEKMNLDAATTVVILEQLMPSLQAMDPLLAESITSPDLSLKRVLDSLDDRKVLNTNLDSNVAYNIDYDTGEISYMVTGTRPLNTTKASLLGNTVSEATLGDLVVNP